jgi:hypothetical protein
MLDKPGTSTTMSVVFAPLEKVLVMNMATETGATDQSSMGEQVERVLTRMLHPTPFIFFVFFFFFLLFFLLLLLFLLSPPFSSSFCFLPFPSLPFLSI